MSVLAYRLAFREALRAVPSSPSGDESVVSANSPAESPSLSFPEWTGKERVNILILGIDQRDGEQGPWRTDTMMVATLDPVGLSAGVLSIPRDLWVTVPGFGENRINTAHFLGDAYGYPGGGIALAQETVRYNLGIPTTYYVRINFAAFEKAIDLLGGIDLCVPEAIDDPHYPDAHYGYEPFRIDAGCQHLDGRTALKYARTRATRGGDFDRMRRQQQVIQAVRERVLRLNMLPSLIARAPALWETVKEGVRTNLTLEQMIALARLAARIPEERIRMVTIGPSMTRPYTTPDGAEVLVRIPEKVREALSDLFGSQVPRLEARVAVQNGTMRPGLAARVAESLRALGVEIVEVGNADRFDYAETRILIRPEGWEAAHQVIGWLDLPLTSIQETPDLRCACDLLIRLGADFPEP
ncbi:LCP family protein [Thermoflexus sp.]|uniref:LCP family protein n=1 Tax=Thermoflexus sp. TaxID=1969742 RepID=UPI0029964E50|nr:LCP family protein [Thermoflexus sp.]MDW8186188.1 LCP family protein [Anaerolineae bacterium]